MKDLVTDVSPKKPWVYHVAYTPKSRRGGKLHIEKIEADSLDDAITKAPDEITVGQYHKKYLFQRVIGAF